MAIQASTGLLFHKPVRVLDILATRILLEIAGASMSFLALGILWISVGWADLPSDMLKVLGGWAMLAWFSSALALNIGALTSLTEIAERLWHPASYILFPLSGAVFMVDWLADEYRRVILWLPMVHCVELIRDGYFGSLVRTHYDMGYVTVVCLAMTATGLALVRLAGRRLKF
jgi:ABC-type polysaccharide/polyol phosphate export permease